MREDVLEAMFRRFPFGFVAAVLQLIAVAMVTPFALAIMWHGSIMGLSTIETQSSIITGTYLILGLGIALTENRFLDSTAVQIRHISHLKPFPRPNLVMALLLILFCLGAVGFTLLALRPPQFLVDLGHQGDWGEMALIAWPGTMSIGAACFGANAHATLRALQW
jgi:hypothetical protein